MRLNDGAAEHAFRYDTLGRLVAASDPDIGARSLEYNDAGWLLKHTNGANQVRTFEYDAGGRLVSTGGDGATYRYHYDAPKPGTDGENLAARLAWVEEPRGEVQLSYDAFGRTVRHARWVEGRWAEELMEFGLSGLQTRGSVDGLVLTPTYDAAGRSIALGNHWQAVELDASGRVLAESYGNGVTQRYTRDELGLPREIGVARPSGQPLYGVRVGRNAWGSPSWVEDTDGVGLNHSATFAYDAAGRLADVVLGAARQGTGPATGAESFNIGPQSFHFTYAYDALQNITSRTATGPKSLDLYAGSYRYGERGLGPRQLSSVATSGGARTLGYDAAGRVSEQDGRTHTYNGLDQLVQVTVPARDGKPAQTVTHAYGYDGLRTVTEGDGATQYWLTPNLVEREGKREWYLRRDDRTLVRLTLQGNAQLAMGGSGGSQGGGVSAGSSAGVRSASTGVLGLLMGLALVLGGVAAARARSGARWQRLHAGVLLAAVLGLSCRGGEGPDLGETAKALRWAIAGAVYFHGGIAAGPVLMTREDGTVYEERRYEPFGAPIDAFRETSSGAAEVGEIDHRAEPLNVLNKETDATSGYSYHGARWLSPHTATWLTPDPPVKAPDPGFMEDPWALHPYQFVKQNPIAYWDPDGHEEKPTGWQKLGAFAWGAAKGVAVGVGTAVVIGAISAVAAPLAVVAVVGMTAYGAYGLINGGAEALAESGKRIVSGEGTLDDFDTFGEVAGGLASGRLAKVGFQKGQSLGSKLKTQKTPSSGPKAVCTGTTCPCSFVAATLVDTEDGLVPIDSVALGERIGPESQECAELELTGWMEVHLETEVTTEGEADLIQLQLLRPVSWLQEHPAQAGKRMAINLEEFKLQGEAQVTYVGRAPELKPGSRCPVIGRLQHSSRELISLTLEGDEQPLQVTKEHPVYSAERDGWVEAANLRPGEVLRTLTGTASVRDVLLSAQPRTEVFDLQVAGTSSYFVSDAKVLAHNCPKSEKTSDAAQAPDYVVTPAGSAYPVPVGASGPKPVVNPAGKVTGTAYTGGKGGANGQVSTIRIMSPTPPRGKSPGYPYGYIKYENAMGQGVDPITGKTIPNAASHFPID
ncbi:MAG: polymorphic toxin-type HINT domain-containing protein [Myxococcota bacterium]|nr:polymorphic toxin-type HINT domain-containing protein [Myxococcota bacterium]